jgi:hypothetical protein
MELPGLASDPQGRRRSCGGLFDHSERQYWQNLTNIRQCIDF